MEQLHFSQLTGEDALGRRLSPAEDLPAPRSGRQVGMFYFLWHEPQENGLIGRFDEMLRTHDKAQLTGRDSLFYRLPWGTPHFWAEPLYGFYSSDDEWVIRRHVELLTMAGIDFLVIDATNLLAFVPQALVLMRVLHDYRAQGFDAPKIMFYTHTDSAERMQQLYDGIYRTQRYPDTWFCLRGKPAIVGDAAAASPEVAAFFTIKVAQWPNEPDRVGGFPWMDFARPQRLFANADGSESIVNVSVAQNSSDRCRFGDSVLYGETGNRGRSFRDGAAHITPESYYYGDNFREQWERAIALDPEMVFVTGWNEWIAGVWSGEDDRPAAIFDCIDGEYSRDIEPMCGGYGDAYYLQLAEYVRRYKGVPHGGTDAAVPDDAPLASTAGIPVLRHFPGAARAHDAQGYVGRLTAPAGRNEITATYAAHDGSGWRLIAACDAALQPADGRGEWMRPYLRVPGGERSPLGYTHYVDTAAADGGSAPLYRYRADGWQPAGRVPCTVTSQGVAVHLPFALTDPQTLRSKWVDSVRTYDGPMAFYEHGSVAPAGRFDQIVRR